MTFKLAIPFLLATGLLCSCNKSLEIEPPKNELTGEKVFADSAGTVAALGGLYTPFSRHGGAIENYFTSYTSLYADEIFPITTPSASLLEFYNSSLLPTNSINANIWSQLYRVVYGANSLLEGLETASSSSPSFAGQAKGEALFLRAFAYLLLVNIYGDVPLVLTTDINQTARAGRTHKEQVYTQVAEDLQKAATLLPVAYPMGEKIRANRWAASALLARVQLYREEWEEAATAATAVIADGNYGPLPPLSNVFLKNSQEAILQFWSRDGNTWSGNFVPASGNPAFGLTPGMLASFEAGDQRRELWTRATGTVRYPYKYKNRLLTTGPAAEYGMALRLAEQYLIRAEAYWNLGQEEAAIEDINVVRVRAGLAEVMLPVSRDSLFQLIVRERRAELFTEWGHRLFDLKRWGMADAALGSLKGGWKSTAQWFPVPQNELLNNGALEQNKGY